MIVARDSLINGKGGVPDRLLKGFFIRGLVDHVFWEGKGGWLGACSMFWLVNMESAMIVGSFVGITSARFNEMHTWMVRTTSRCYGQLNKLGRH